MRKVTLSIILILLIVGCYQVLFGNVPFLREYVASVSELKASSKRLNTQLAQLEKSSDYEFAEKKKELSKVIEDYRTSKQDYEQVVSQFSTETAETLLQIQENSLKDIYDVDFLWTIVGNYATEEGINLKFDVVKNTTSASSLNNTSTNYVVCDLQFIITGNYINLTDFIYDLEDDDRLNFEINDFDMQKSGNDLQVTLNVREIKINADNFIESASNTTNTFTEEETTDKEEEKTQTIDSTTSKNTISNTTTN